VRIEQLMTRFPRTCGVKLSLGEAARLMLENGCGCLPVTAEDGSGRLVGMITDRDICMAAESQGKALRELLVGDAMEPVVWACNPEDSIDEAEEIMREVGVRRLPVVDGLDRLLGVLSLTDLAREALRQRGSKQPEISVGEVGELLASICERSHEKRADPSRNRRGEVSYEASKR